MANLRQNYRYHLTTANFIFLAHKQITQLAAGSRTEARVKSVVIMRLGNQITG
jgi:hypothetical protein